MRVKRPQDAASNPRRHRFGGGVVRVLSVTAVAATACAMMAGAASAATAAPAAATPTTTTVGPAAGKAGPVTLSGAVYAMGANITDGMGSLAFYRGTTLIKGCAAVLLKTFTAGDDNVGTCTTTLAAGTYTINVKFSGDPVNVASAGSVTLFVS